MVPFPNKRYITFDCYGTVIDWEGGIRNALQQLAERKGLTLNMDGIAQKYIDVELEVESEQYRSYREVLRLTASRLLKAEGVDIAEDDALRFADSIYSWQPFPETRQVLTILQDRGYELIILSNIDNELVKRSIELMNVEFSGVITAEDVGSYKPAFGHWRAMLERFNATKAEVLHVAASYIHDIVPAKEQGFDAVWINRNRERPTRNIHPDLELSDLSPLPAAIEYEVLSTPCMPSV
jgi:2-haloalkanoic acid dehalogenase type II